MPTAIIPIIAYAAGAITATALIVNLAIIAGSVALSSYQKRKAKSRANAAFDSAQVDRLVNIQTAIDTRKLLLGRVRTGGTIFFRSTVGAYKELLVECIAIAGHEIDAVERIYFNDQPVDMDGSGNVLTAPYARQTSSSQRAHMTSTSIALPYTPIAGSVSVYRGTSFSSSDQTIAGGQENVPFSVAGNVVSIGSYDPTYTYYVNYQETHTLSFARVRWHLGAPGQAADSRMQGLLPGVWTADHKATGVAYLIAEFDYDETAYPSGIPNITALVRGAKMYDPRNGLTQFSENPALMMRHVIMHPAFGKRTSMTAAEDARIVAAANACDTGISYTGSDWVETYRAAVVIPFGQPARDALDDLSQAMGGQWAYASGEFFVRAGVYQAPVMALTDSDLAVVQRTNDGSTSQSPISISTHRARNEKVNTILARIWDQAANYVQTPIQPFRAASLVTADGAELAQEITMPAVFYAGQAFHISGIILRDGRDPLTVTLPFKLKAYQLELFDTVTLTLSRYGWSAKEFQILGRRLMPDGFIELTLKETAAAIYVYGAGFVPQGYADNSGLPRPWDIVPPSITAITSGESDLIIQSDGTIVNGVRVTWAPILDASIASSGYVEVQYALMTDGIWRSQTVPGSDTQLVFAGVADRAAIVVRARAKNAVAVSDWSLQVAHIVIGKTEPPPDIRNLSISGSVLSWSLPRRVPDLAGFVFRFHYGSNLDWNSGTPLHTGLITESPYDLITRPGGVVSIMGKAIDTTGNVSKYAANIVMNLGDPPVANVIEQWDFNALGWPFASGEQSGWTIVSGKPSADAVDSLYGTDDQSFYGSDGDSFYDASAYGRMIYVSSEISVSAALAGSIMTLVFQALGTDVRVDYRLAGPGSLYEADNSSFYGDDADPFYGPPGAWQPWPGQIVAANEIYQFRVTIGAGVVRGILQGLAVTIDAPDINESIADVVVAAAGTVVPYTKPYSSIKVVQATLQANGSGAVTVEVNKTNPLAPVIKAYNSAHTAVSGATVDIVLQGY